MAEYYAQTIDEVVGDLGTDVTNGLSSDEARARLEKYGINQLAEKPRATLWEMFLDQFKDFLIMILIVSAIISFFLGVTEYRHTGEITEFVDAGAIIAIVILNATLGVIQESRAENALAALKKLAAPTAYIIRDGYKTTIPSPELVPGDIVLLEAGNFVPADLRLVESVNLKVDEASLTGESVPVQKEASAMLMPDSPLGDRRNSAYMSTVVTYGRGKGIVVNTGMKTEIGKIAEMIQSYEEEATPLQVRLDQLGKWLGVASLVICGLVGLIGVVRDTNLGLIASEGLFFYLGAETEMLIEMFMTAVSLAIAAVPEGLPAVVTICLALGMQEMLKRHALIRKLHAVETLGSATVICSDKTGTLTQNEMMVVRSYTADRVLKVTGKGYDPEGEIREGEEAVDKTALKIERFLYQGGLLCNDATLEKHDGSWRMVGDPTEGALVVGAAKWGLWSKDEEERHPRLAEIPFDSERKRMTTIHDWSNLNGDWRIDAPYIAFVKGAPDVLLELCDSYATAEGVKPMTAAFKDEILRANSEMAQDALRVLGVAYRPLQEVPEEPSVQQIEKELTFIGLQGMIDPARPEVRDAVAVARKAGLKSVMITGDYKDTAVAIAKELNILTPGGKVMTGNELDTLDEDAFVDMVEDIAVYARVSPEHKVKIVEAFKQRGHVAAMTGDGVNDAPALQRSSIGVAMGITGTDVAKQTADMVLTDDNYASIVSAIEEGRIIYSNIRKFVYYLISCNVGEILVIFLAMLFGWPVPLRPIQLLWLNLVTDGAPALALGMEKGEPGIMERPPRPVKEPVINKDMWIGIAIQAIAITGAVLVSFYYGMRHFHVFENPTEHNIMAAQTVAFTVLTLSELFRAFTSRSEYQSIFSIGVFSNKWMLIAVGSSFLLFLCVLYVPFLQPLFSVVPLNILEWEVALPLIFLPSIAAELTKFYFRSRTR